MGTDDKAHAKTEGAVGKAKEALGKATGDDSMRDEGKAEQSKADLKHAGEKVKDAFKR
ncbi:MAG TPA: CsbD family protein [Nocardioides sp.]|jgi:uncharacterized protein YjbJ (UPF0337 family)|nr:CsbD family protein [uncultured Nocardioides sp.]HEX5987290.1 CsbD family protein [Nocardioides sp.]